VSPGARERAYPGGHTRAGIRERAYPGGHTGAGIPERAQAGRQAGRQAARAGEAGAPEREHAVPPAVLLTAAGKRYDIVSCFARLTRTIVTDPAALAPAQYAAHVRVPVPMIEDPAYVSALEALCEEHGVGAVLPLTDLDIEILARARAEGRLPALVPSPEVARATYDKYEAHLLLERLGLPSPVTVLPDAELEALHYPVMVKPRRGSGARSIHRAEDASQARFFIGYVREPVMIQRAMNGPELSIDCLGDLDGRCLNAIPRSMLESRGGESIKGTVVGDRELVDLGRRTMEALRVTGPATIQVFRDPDVGLAITDVNTRFGGAFPAPVYAAHAGQSYPELIVRMAAGERVPPHVGEFREGMTFTRYYWQLELDESLQPTGREIVAGGPPAPR
jgi:carbamoyl-phosphate synthase large subunit